MERELTECERIAQRLDALCESFPWDPESCVTTATPMGTSLDERQQELIGPGVFVAFGDATWFVSDDVDVATNNGVAMAACSTVQGMPELIARRLITTAPDFKETSKTYKGVYNNQGAYRHDACTKFEVKIAQEVDKALWAEPDADERRIFRREAQRTAMKASVLKNIHGKISTVCPEILNLN